MTSRLALVAATCLWPLGCSRDGARVGPQELRIDFAEGEFEPQWFQLYGGDSPTKLCRFEKGGLRIDLTDVNVKPDYAGINLRARLKGDFELEAAYRMLHVAPCESGTGVGLSIGVKDVDGEWATSQRVHQRDKGHLFVAYCQSPQKDGAAKSEHAVRIAKEDRGRLKLRRTGGTIEVLVADGTAEPFKLLLERHFGMKEVREMTIGAKRGGSPTPVDVVFESLALRAQQLELPGRTAAVTKKDSKWTVLLAIGGVTAGVVCAVVILLRRRRS